MQQTSFLAGRKFLNSVVILTLIMAGLYSSLQANNILVNNVVLTGRDTSAGADNAANFTRVQFDLSWSNSWRSNAYNNWDAAWVFVKFRLGTLDYLSAPGATDSADVLTVHTTAGLRPGMPVFVHSGNGAFAANTVITSILSSTRFRVSAPLTTPLSNLAVVRAERIWEHAWLHNTGHAKGSISSTASLQVGLKNEGAAYDSVTNPVMGVYFYRSGNGTGGFSTTAAQLRWNYGAQGIRDNDIVEMRVFALEMVHVPQGGFQVCPESDAETNAVLLLTGTGQNNSTTIADSSGYTRAISRAGDTKISTTNSPFAGGSSIQFDGSGDYLQAANATEMNFTGDFTLESWVYPVSNSNIQHLFARSGDGSATVYLSGNILTFHYGRFTYDIFGGLYTPNGPAYSGNVMRLGNKVNRAANNWYHVALTRSGNVFRLFVNGIMEDSVISTAGWYGYPLNIGTPAMNSYGGISGAHVAFSGFMDDIGLYGFARYTSAFTPPSSPMRTNPVSYTINSEDSLLLGGSLAGNLRYQRFSGTADDFSSSTTQWLPSTFPKGYNGFYCMKYELSQQQWINFFNSLTTVQDTARDITSPSGKNSDAVIFRNNISWGTGVATLVGGTSGGVACNYLNWADGCAYADWAGLRPMTELEYEKACRGTTNAIFAETASGRRFGSLIGATGITSGGAAGEVPTNTTANGVYNNNGSVQGPLRVGALATSTSTRMKAGASYYGILDLSGNLSEQVVSLGSADGRSFLGVHGDGQLTQLGRADVVGWPGLIAGEITGSNGTGCRGGNWQEAASRLAVSNRFYANSPASTRTNLNGFRAVRSAPSTPAE